jgi:branched-chain amino acid transport system permease protein
MRYLLHLLIYLEIYIIVALSLNLVVGYCGLLTLSHAGYYAIGGYVYAVLTLKFGWEFIPAVIAGATLSAVLSLAVSLPSWRLHGDFFVIATLAVQALIFSMLYNWYSVDAPLGSWRNLTNGPFGITGIPNPTIFGWQVVSPFSFALFSSLITLACGVVIWRLKVSPWGRLLLAIREDELAARGLGKNTRLAKVQAFAISAAFAAIAGSLYAAYVHYIDPSSASLDESILMLSMIIVGGLGNLSGPIVGAVIIIGLPEILRFLALPAAQSANLRMLIYGLLLIVMMHYRPQGMAGEYRMQ